MNKKNSDLLSKANENLLHSEMMKQRESLDIDSTYKGKTAALGVSIAMMGFLPTIANYYQDFKADAPCGRKILDVVAKMIPGHDFSNAKALFEFVLENKDNTNVMSQLKQEFIDCTIALKLVVRTYNLD